MSDMTIRELRTTLLRLPWPEDPWLAGHALGPTRDLVVVEVVTAGGEGGEGVGEREADLSPARRGGGRVSQT